MNGLPDWAGRMAELARAADGLAVELLLCPPFPLIPLMANGMAGDRVRLGAQDCHAEPSGAHTGEVSAELLAALGCAYVIVGHSERRAGGEADMDVKAKAEAAHRAGLVPIVCVGEQLPARDAGRARDVVLGQLAGSLPQTVGEVVVAYEPVWAIGTGRAAQVGDIAEMHMALRAEVGEGVRLLYGGSVKPGNAGKIFAVEDVDGALVGGASLEVESFAEVARAAAG